MPAAARVMDPTTHNGQLQGAGVATVRIKGQAAAVANDPRVSHPCPIKSSTPPHPNSPILGGSLTVTIGGSAAARVGDKTSCGAVIQLGASTVLIGG